MKHPLFGLRVMNSRTEEEYIFIEFLSGTADDDWATAITLDSKGKVVCHHADDLEFNIEKVNSL